MQPLRGLARTEVIEIAKDQDPAVQRRKFDDSATNRPDEFSANQRLVLRLTARSEDVAIAVLLTEPPSTSPIILHCFINSHASHPRAKAGF